MWLLVSSHNLLPLTSAAKASADARPGRVFCHAKYGKAQRSPGMDNVRDGSRSQSPPLNERSEGVTRRAAGPGILPRKIRKGAKVARHGQSPGRVPKGLINKYPRAESNRNLQNRNLKFYPLNYGGKTTQRYTKSARIPPKDIAPNFFTEIWHTFRIFQ